MTEDRCICSWRKLCCVYNLCVLYSVCSLCSISVCVQVWPAEPESYGSTESRCRCGLVFWASGADWQGTVYDVGQFRCRVMSRRGVQSAARVFADITSAGGLLPDCLEAAGRWRSAADRHARLTTAASQPALHARLEKDDRVDRLCQVSLREATAPTLHGVSQTCNGQWSTRSAGVCWRRTLYSSRQGWLRRHRYITWCTVSYRTKRYHCRCQCLLWRPL